VSSALTALLNDLRVVTTPQNFTKPNDGIIRAAQNEIQGLMDRDKEIQTNDNPLFTTALNELGNAATQFQTAYGEFPSPRPSPQLFGAGRHVN
jgi:hypothetical protein